jgi:hypothetical protein
MMNGFVRGAAGRHDIGCQPDYAPRSLKNPIGMQQNCWQPHGKLLASGNAVSDWNGARQRSMMADLPAVQAT